MQQDLDHVAEPDIGRGCCSLTRRRRQRDFGQQRERHGKDHGIGLEARPVVTACGDSAAQLLDGDYGSAEVNRGTVSAAFVCEMLDESTIASLNPSVLAVVPGHP